MTAPRLAKGCTGAVRRPAAVRPRVLAGGCALAVLVAASRASATAPSEQQCLDRFRAETVRIEREFAARRRAAPPATQAEQQAFARDLHAALAKAADAAEACTRAAKRAPR